MSLDATPLIEETSNGSQYGTIEEQETLYTEEPKQEPNAFYKRLFWLCLLGIGAMIVAQLTFLPRTSPNRDYRRMHGLKLTKADIERQFVLQLLPGNRFGDNLTTEEHIHVNLKNLSSINGRSPTGMAASLTPDLFNYVKSRMSGRRFTTQTYSYELPPSLKAPISLSLTLYESSRSRKLYSANLTELYSSTPAFFPFSSNGTIRKAYINAHTGSPKDYELLAKNNISVEDRIVIISHSIGDEYALSDKIALVESLGCAGVVVYGDEHSPHAISRTFSPKDIPKQQFRLPISYKEVQPILVALGPAVGDFDSWHHAPYSDFSLELELSCNFGSNTLLATDIVSTMHSSLHDGVIIIGASRDSYTDSNPLSGHAIMFELMRQFSVLQDKGWRPLRTIKFVSWDASRSLSLDSTLALSDSKFLRLNGPILAYINLDNDVVTGNRFSVDSNPLFDDVLKHAALFVSIPRRLNLVDNTEGAGLALGDHSLLNYWQEQDNCTINNKLGYFLAGKDSGSFQFRQIPTINLKFDQSSNKTHDYIPESCYYCYEWIMQQDDGLLLHGSLVRFVGLLLISLGENEVVSMQTASYFSRLSQYFIEVIDSNKKKNNEWATEDVHNILNANPNSSLYKDILGLVEESKSTDTDGPVMIEFLVVLKAFKLLLLRLVKLAEKFDAYSKEVKNLWTTDLPWFKFVRKLIIISKFKRLNKKLIGFEQFSGPTSANYSHVMYDIPQGIIPEEEKIVHGAFASLYEAYDTDSLKEVVLAMVPKYEKLKAGLTVLCV